MPKKQNNIGLVWFRNDLRVQDNAVLKEAIEKHKHVIACYFFDPRHFEKSEFGFKKTEKFRVRFLIESIQDLKQNLRKQNIELFVYQNRPEDKLIDIVEHYQISDIYLQKEWTDEEMDVLTNVQNGLPESVNYHQLFNQFLYHPADISMGFHAIPEIFSEFRKKLEKHSLVRPALQIKSATPIDSIHNDSAVPSLNDLGFEDFETHPNSAFPFKGGETAAMVRLDDYFFKTKKLGFYKKTRNGLIGTDFSSKFSPWLANGCLSARTIYWNVRQFEMEYLKNQSTYWLIFELIWRDYFKYISLKHNNNIFKIGGILQKEYEWKTDKEHIQNWIDGYTPSDFVNANMIELRETGWMSNRGRQNVASFFAKDLLLDWRIGAAYFEAMLIDYDVHSNYGNWMYVAGVGNDPRDRKFNVDLQAERYDGSGKFRNIWLQHSLF